MWFWLMIILIVVGILAVVIGNYLNNNTKYYMGWLLGTGYVISIVASIVALVMGIFIIISHTNIEAKIAENERVYESLTYQLENNLYDNDNDLGKKELYHEIEEWNSDLAYYQNAQSDFWVGIFYPNIFDRFKFIEYSEQAK